MAEHKRSKQEGYRDWFYVWTTAHIESDYNFIMPVLVKTLKPLLTPWNSSITQVQEAREGKPAIYEITFGAVSGTVADKIVEDVAAKMREMEERKRKMQFLHEPEGWFADE